MARDMPGREHIPNYPPGWVAIRFLQLFLAVATLGLAAYTVYATRTAAATNGLALFTALATVVVGIWLVCAHTCAPRAYNYWAALFFDVYLYVFWLATFSLAAVWAGVVFAAGSVYRSKRAYSFCDDYFDKYSDVAYYNRYCRAGGSSSSSTFYGVNYKIFGGVVAGIAGLGAIEFLLFFISWVTDAVVIYKHRRGGGRAGFRVPHLPAGSAAAPHQVPMHPQTKTDYHAVPQQGIPFAQQGPAYHSQHHYQQQAFYPPPQSQPQPLALQHTGSTYVQTHTPPPGGYPAPQYPPQQPAAPYHQTY